MATLLGLDTVGTLLGLDTLGTTFGLDNVPAVDDPSAAGGIVATAGPVGVQPQAPRTGLIYRPDVGTLVELQALITIEGDLVDPAAVTVEVQTPGADLLPDDQIANTNPAPGVYLARFVVSEQGRYSWWWQTTGIPKVAHVGYFEVNPSPFSWPAEDA